MTTLATDADGTHSESMQTLEGMGFVVVPGFATVFCFDGRDAAIAKCRESSEIITFWLDGRRTLMVPCVDGCFELPFGDKDECFTAYRVLDEFGYLAYGSTEGVGA